ncbi:conserved hypothetical protein [Photobacterium leiognathi lrivu.4.1]|uniref:Integrase n=1 Tax=Photobacterium leiognathi lrivu.4.1 TaxID=1248232 RepID=V5F8A9_PHOLE|nr:hypothetical protein [Photobacterium leiognathi]GAD32468.1 conserved hypothetical protein [Photobacterium leiognathi lrivu.4.1]
MPIEHLYLNSFPEKHKVEEVDVVTLYHEGRFDALDKVIICKNDLGEVMATFGDSDWYCYPFSRNKVNNKNYLQFSFFDNHPELQRELKLFVYGWLFNKNPQDRKASKFSTVHAKLDNARYSYNYLVEHGFSSIRVLSNPSEWSTFESYLVEKNYAKKVIENCFTAINAVIKDGSWHKVKHGFSALIQSGVLSTKLNSIEGQQTLTIPERLCDAIYGKAIELIEGAHPYRDLIAQIENDLQENYLEGKRILDEKVANGATYVFMLANGKIDTSSYSMNIRDNQPQSPSDIIARLAKKLPDIPLNNGYDFQRYRGQLITSSYIVCGGFSGMRDSELDKLTPNSYYKDTFEGRDYHMLQSHTFKLGEQQETWVTASSSKVAIELMTAITTRWRQETDYPDKKYENTLWVSQKIRSKAPVLIADWNARLKGFCKQFGFIVTEEDYQECLDSNPKSHEKVKKQVIVGEPWPMTPHQFRRTLAFYCIKNRFGTMVALKQQFKHLYLAMAEWYTNGGKLASYRSLVVDEKIQAMLENINAETTANKIFKQWHSNEKLSGSHGKAIVKMRGDIPTIYSSWDVIYQAVKDGKLTLHGSLHSYCKSGYDCDMDGVVAPQFCVDCSSGSSIIDEQQAKWWKRKHSSLVAYMGSGEDISVSEKSHYITQVRAAESVMRDFDMDFVPFEAELNIVEV